MNAPFFRWLALGLFVLFVLLQVKLWAGQGGLSELWELQARAAAQAEENKELLLRNQALAADVVDLKRGQEAVEERARYELGMIKRNEVFYQVLSAPQKP